MNELLIFTKDLLACCGIHQAAPIPFSDCILINEPLLTRHISSPRTVIAMLIPYRVSFEEERNLSRYAISRDYHLFARELGDVLCHGLSDKYPNEEFAFFCDHSPIDERDACAKAGLGVIGDHGLLISPRYGSYVFLAELITSVSLSCHTVPIRTCMHCGACRAACPSPDGCLSAITQKKGELTKKEIEIMKACGSVWGCDICQSVCPMNENTEPSGIDFFLTDRIPFLTCDRLRSMDKDELKSRAYGWRGRSVIERNLKLLEPDP